MVSRWINATGSSGSPTASDKENSSKKSSPMNESDFATAASNDVPKARTAHELAAMFEQTPPPPPPPGPPPGPPPAVRGHSPVPGGAKTKRNEARKDDSPQLMYQKKQWDASKDIPRGMVRNSPFTPAPEVPPPQPPQLMHQKNQWDASRDIPRGKVSSAVRGASEEKRVMSPPKSLPSPVSPTRIKNDQWAIAKGSSSEEDPPQTRHQHKQWNAKNDIPAGTVQHSPFGKKEFFKEDMQPSGTANRKTWGDIGIEEGGASHDIGTQKSEDQLEDANAQPWDVVGDPSLTLDVTTSKSNDTWSTASPLSSPTSTKRSLLGVPSDEESSSPLKNSTEQFDASPRDIPGGTERGMANIFEGSPATQPASNISIDPVQPELTESPVSGEKDDVDDDGFFVATSPKEEEVDPWIVSDTPSSQLFPTNDAKWGASVATSPDSNDWDSGSKEWFQGTSFDADTKDVNVSKPESSQAATEKKSVAESISYTADSVLEPAVAPSFEERDSVMKSTVSQTDENESLKGSKKEKKKRGIFKLFGGVSFRRGSDMFCI